MRVLIVSDSHLSPNLDEIYDYEQPDYALHAGDSQLLANDKNILNYNIVVKGNCDYEKKYPNFQTIKILNQTILVTHGHLYHVGYEFKILIKLAIDNSANIAIYGHLHEVNDNYQQGVLLINPGSVAQSRSKYPVTYMILDLVNNQINLKHAKSFKVIETFNI